MMQSRTKLGMAGIGLAALGGAFLATPEPADSASYNIWGELNTGGNLVQYTNYRTHLVGASSLNITSNVATYSRFGLRNHGGTQITETNQYNGSGGYQPFRMKGTQSQTIPAGEYALNGRMGECTLCWRFWEGILVI